MRKPKVAVKVNDLMQENYVYYLTEAPGRNFHPGFKPQLTPQEMLALGVFGGKYLTDCRKEFPASWFRRAKLCRERPDPALNYFGVNASQPLSVWRRQGWIYHEDPCGWFQWYCRYYRGRRYPDDERQIKRCGTTSHRAIKAKLSASSAGLPAPAASGAAAPGL
ncbi:MAG TPA: hypothetical protein VKD91_21520 [Pyrinomonadaceae bacterium]|nr:hypothetical protein [Pyrinomonadaceae bacterium]